MTVLKSNDDDELYLDIDGKYQYMFDMRVVPVVYIGTVLTLTFCFKKVSVVG